MLGSLRVKAVGEEEPTYDLVMVTVRRSTRILRREEDGMHEAAFDDLRAGQRVQVEFAGGVRESYPVQVDAAVVVILEPAPHSQKHSRFPIQPKPFASFGRGVPPVCTP